MQALSVTSFADFKSANNLSSVDVLRSSNGKLFVRVGSSRIGIAEGTDLSLPLVVIEMEHEGQTWSFIAQQKTEPAVKVATI